MPEPKEGFIPAQVGDYAAFESETGVWVFGQVKLCTKNPPRVRTLLDKDGQEHKVGPKHHIRVAPLGKLDTEKIERVWREGPSVFNSWEAVSAAVVPCKRSQTDG